MSLKIDWATHDAAKFACENWHYSESMPVPPLLKVGAWEDDKFIGCVIFSRGATPNLLRPYGLSQTNGCELTRIALRNHKAEVSKIVSIAIKFLKRSNPDLRLIVSFADPNEGHHGGIYQAGNWLYTGRTSAAVEYIDKKGRKWHGRQVSSSGFKEQFGAKRPVPKISDCTRVKCEGKHRYLMPLDEKMRTKIEPLRKPYPKRAGSKANVATEFHSVEGGATPTSALQLKEINGET